MPEQESFEIQIDLNILNHLGIGLYSNTPAVITEIISNAWDADAELVEITTDIAKRSFTIKDNGHGMSGDDIKNKFLKVGYARRNDQRQKSDLKQRPVMGRKGIGKLAMFSIADEIIIHTKKKDNEAVAFKIDVKKLQSAIKNNALYQAEEVTPDIPLDHGTIIELRNIKHSITQGTITHLRKRLARRFSIIGSAQNFIVKVDEQEINADDRDYYSSIQFLWQFPNSDDINAKCSNVVKTKIIDKSFIYQGNEYPVTGYIASVLKPDDLKKDKEVSNNTITVMANGRVFQEDILSEFGSAKVFTNYLVGEIGLDILDDTNLPDMATSSRQQLQQDDPRYPALKAFITSVLQAIDTDWDTFRKEVGSDITKQEFPILEDWINSFTDSRDKKTAQKLIGQIHTLRFSGNEEEQKNAKKTILKNTVLAFEKFRLQNNLDQLENISITSNDFKNIFISINDIEASLYHDITKQRLEIINKLKDITDKNQLEKVVQQHLFDHLWLLDPTWERAIGKTFIEQTLTKELKQACPDATTGARVDIAVLTSSLKHIIIELKRPNVRPKFDELIAQGRKYVVATEKWYENHPEEGLNSGDIKIKPSIEVIFLVGSIPNDYKPNDVYTAHQLSSINASLKTYDDLIHHSKEAYSEYLNKHQEADKIKNILDQLDQA